MDINFSNIFQWAGIFKNFRVATREIVSTLESQARGKIRAEHQKQLSEEYTLMK